MPDRAEVGGDVERVLAHLLPLVRTWMFRLLGPRAGLDDAVQDAMIAIAKALPRFRGEASVETYAHSITVRAAYKHMRTPERREVPLELVPPVATELDPESLAAQREVLRRLYRCLERMPRRRRTALVLCDIEGYSPTEAAGIAGVRPAAMRSRLRHARAELERRLGGDEYLATLFRKRGGGR